MPKSIFAKLKSSKSKSKLRRKGSKDDLLQEEVEVPSQLTSSSSGGAMAANVHHDGASNSILSGSTSSSDNSRSSCKQCGGKLLEGSLLQTGLQTCEACIMRYEPMQYLTLSGSTQVSTLENNQPVATSS